jgi:hypothetical protein
MLVALPTCYCAMLTLWGRWKQAVGMHAIIACLSTLASRERELGVMQQWVGVSKLGGDASQAHPRTLVVYKTTCT